MSDFLLTMWKKTYCFRVGGEVHKVVADEMSEEDGYYVLRKAGEIVGKIMEGVSAWWIENGHYGKKFGCATVRVRADGGEFEFGVVICQDCRSKFDDIYPAAVLERSTVDFEDNLFPPTKVEAKKLLSDGILVGPCCVRCGAYSEL